MKTYLTITQGLEFDVKTLERIWNEVLRVSDKMRELGYSTDELVRVTPYSQVIEVESSSCRSVQDLSLVLRRLNLGSRESLVGISPAFADHYINLLKENRGALIPLYIGCQIVHPYS